MNVLFVCTANQCRSPLAEALFRQRLDGAAEVDVRSRGLLPGGVPCPPELVEAAEAVGLDLSDHSSETITADDLEWASLIITMTREHVREIVVETPSMWRRCFTLLEWTRRTVNLGGLSTLDEIITIAGDEREMSALLGDSGEDDVPDPMGQGRRTYEKLVRQLTPLVEGLAVQLSRVADSL